MVGGLAAVGLPVAFERNFFEQPEASRRTQLLYSAMAFTAGTFAVCAVVTWLLSGPISLWLTGQSGTKPCCCGRSARPPSPASRPTTWCFFAIPSGPALFSAYMIGERLLSAALSVGLVAGVGAGVVGLVAGQLLAGVVIFMIIGVRFLRTNPVMFDRVLLVDALRVGYPLMPRVLLGVVGNNIDKYLVGRLTSLGGVGIYSIGQRVANIGFTYMTALQNVFGPQVYTRMFSSDPDAGAAIGRYLTPFAYASTVLAFLIAVFAEETLTLLAPASYRAAIPIVTILASYYAILFFGKMPQMAYARKTYLISVIGAASTGFSVAFGAAGIWLFGTVGAAWGALAAGVATTTLTVVVGQRCYRIEWERRKLSAIFGLLFLSAFMTMALRSAGTPYVWTLGAKGAAVAAFIWLGVRLEIVTRENLRLVRSLVLGRAGRIGGIREEHT